MWFTVDDGDLLSIRVLHAFNLSLPLYWPELDWNMGLKCRLPRQLNRSQEGTARLPVG